MMQAPQIVSWSDLAGGLERSATVILPAGPVRAVWTCFHGAGGTGLWTLEESALGPVASAAGALLVFPEGRRHDPRKSAGFLTNPQVWDDGSGRFDEYLSPGDDLEYCAALMERIGVAAPGCPIHFVGFSNGAAFAHRAVRAQAGFAASLVLICGIPFPERGESEFTPFSPAPPLLTIHGGKDPILPWEGGATVSPWTRKRETRPALAPLLDQWITALGAAPIVDEAAYEGLARRLRGLDDSNAWIESYLVEEMGHHWPGGLGRINWRLAGPPSWRLDGNFLLRDFFQRVEAGTQDLAAIANQTDPQKFQPIPKKHPTVVSS